MTKDTAKSTGKMLYKNKGVTMVELIVTFALLAIFLAAASMCISHAVIFFFDEQQRLSSFTIADAVFSEVKSEIRTMQGSTDEHKGYVKLRKTGGAADYSGGTYTGTTIEYLASSIGNGATAVQIDTAGCDNYLIDIKDNKLKVITLEDGTTTSNANLPAGYLTMRYYSQYSENDPKFENKFMDIITAGSEAINETEFNSISGSKVVSHAQEKLPVKMYQYNNKSYQVELQFSVTPRNDGMNDIVDYVDVTVFVKDGTETIYQKTRRVDLQNVVYYNKNATMYSDITS